MLKYCMMFSIIYLIISFIVLVIHTYVVDEVADEGDVGVSLIWPAFLIGGIAIGMAYVANFIVSKIRNIRTNKKDNGIL